MGKYLGKRYGDTRTDLILTEKAQKVYDVTDPIDITSGKRTTMCLSTPCAGSL